jgi:hypothetical protein
MSTNNNLNVCFNGCSFTVGEGFPEQLRDDYIYDRLLTKKFNFNSTNNAQPGAGNYVIFMCTVKALKEKKYDIIFVQWSALNRLWLSPGPETWYVATINKGITEYQYRNIYLGKKDKLKFEETVTILNHDYQNIFDLITYCDVLSNLATINSTKLVFINGHVPWQDDLIKPFDTNDPGASLSDYTKNMLEFDDRSDEEIILYFSKLQQKFTELDQSKWVNLFKSCVSSSPDKGPLGNHPGIQGHALTADKISNYLINNQIL